MIPMQSWYWPSGTNSKLCPMLNTIQKCTSLPTSLMAGAFFLRKPCLDQASTTSESERDLLQLRNDLFTLWLKLFTVLFICRVYLIKCIITIFSSPSWGEQGPKSMITVKKIISFQMSKYNCHGNWNILFRIINFLFSSNFPWSQKGN